MSTAMPAAAAAAAAVGPGPAGSAGKARAISVAGRTRRMPCHEASSLQNAPALTQQWLHAAAPAASESSAGHCLKQGLAFCAAGRKCSPGPGQQAYHAKQAQHAKRGSVRTRVVKAPHDPRDVRGAAAEEVAEAAGQHADHGSLQGKEGSQKESQKRFGS